jgi:LysM repeat protein
MYYDNYPTSTSRKFNTTVHTSSSKAVSKLLVRTILMILVALIAFAVGAYVQANAGTTDKRTYIPEQTSYAASTSVTVVVEQGDTLWDIAKAYAPFGTDVRHYVEQIKRANQLTGSTLQIGKKLKLP